MFAALLIALALGYALVVCAYRLYFHPLARIPGPKLAAVSSLYEIYYDVVLPGRYVFKIKELHEKFGPIIRITPREVHFSDPSILAHIYPSSISLVRDKDGARTRGIDVRQATAATTDHHTHRLRREYLSPFFSQKKVLSLESLIQRKAAQLGDWFGKVHRDGSVLNVYDLFYAFARDVVFNVSFAKDSNELASLSRAAALRYNLTRLLLSFQAGQHFSLFFQSLRYLPNLVASRLTPPGVQDMTILGDKIRQEVDAVLESFNTASTVNDTENEENRATNSETKPNQHQSIFAAMVKNPEIPPSELHPARLASEGNMLVMAGTESTAKTLGIVTFHLLSSPSLMHDLRTALTADTAWPKPVNIVSLQNVEYLMALLSEGSRLGFGLAGRNTRILPNEELRYGQYMVPRGIPVSMTTLCIHTNEELFPEPDKFIPERWMGVEGRARQKWNYGFGRGSRRCLGMQLANAEMVLVLAEVARWDCELYETDRRDVSFEHEYVVAFPKLDSKGIKVKVKGRVDV